jgi:peroxiredoxin
LLSFDIALVVTLRTRDRTVITAKDFGDRISLENSLLTLIVFFSGRSCEICMEEATIWHQILQDFDRTEIQIVGVISDRTGMNALSDKLKIDAPIILDKKGHLARRYNIRFDPFKILISRQGHILYMGHVSPRRITQEDFYYEVADILRNLKMAEFNYRIAEDE